jgi:hypothetical protein
MEPPAKRRRCSSCVVLAQNKKASDNVTKVRIVI